MYPTEFENIKPQNRRYPPELFYEIESQTWLGSCTPTPFAPHVIKKKCLVLSAALGKCEKKYAGGWTSI